MAALIPVEVTFHLLLYLVLRDSRSRVLCSLARLTGLHPAPKVSPNSSASHGQWGVSNAGGPPRPVPPPPEGRNGPEAASAPRVSTLLADAALRPGWGDRTRPDLASLQQHRTPTAPAYLQRRDESNLDPSRALRTRGRSSLPIIALYVITHSAHVFCQADTPLPQPALFGLPHHRPVREGPAPPAKPRPSLPSGRHAQARARVPPPPPLPRGPCRSRLCHLTVVVARGGRGAASSAGPPLPRPSGRAGLGSPPLPPFPTPVGYGKVQAVAGCQTDFVADAATGPDGSAEPLSGEALRVRSVQGPGPEAQPHHAG